MKNLVRDQIAMLTILGILSLWAGFSVAADPAPPWHRPRETREHRDSRLHWWRNARFGMFIHWGVYAATGGEYKGFMPPNSAEWMMNRARIPIAEYIKENVQRFNPTNFNARALVRLAREAGMRYLVFTAKHHDGFSMFASKASSYNVVEATPFKRDVVRELAEACRDEGIRFGFYYSQAQDWHHPGGLGNTWDKTLKRVPVDQYVQQKALPEVRQLLTEYGPIAILWWDTPRQMSKKSLDALYALAGLQPGLITNDRLGKDYPGDYKTFERKIPVRPPEEGDWEVCMPISGSWGYKKTDTDFKSVPTLIHNLVDIASKGGNYLLNVSPTGDGTLLPQAVERLQAIGRWMKVNSMSIYGTSASPFGPLEWGRCTKKVYAGGAVLYLHVFDWPSNGRLAVPGLRNPVMNAYLMSDWRLLKTEQTKTSVVVHLPATAPDPIDTVVVLHVDGPLKIDPPQAAASAEGVIRLSAETAYIHNNEGTPDARLAEHDGITHIGYWVDPQAWIEWWFQIQEPGRYELTAELSVEAPRSRFYLGLAGMQKVVETHSTGGYGSYTQIHLGSIDIPRSGKWALQIRPDPDHWQPINLRSVQLVKRE